MKKNNVAIVGNFDFDNKFSILQYIKDLKVKAAIDDDQILFLFYPYNICDKLLDNGLVIYPVKQLSEMHNQYQFNRIFVDSNNFTDLSFLHKFESDKKDLEVKVLTETYNHLSEKSKEMEKALVELLNSNSWKITKPLRTFSKVNSKLLVFLLRFLRAIKNGILSKKIKKTKIVKSDSKEIKKQQKTIFEKMFRISILVPLYNTKADLLKKMIESVISQTYGNWQLCLADASDCEHDYVKEICTSYAKNDLRITYRKLAENKGISENTNECAKLADGDYIAMLDHDDEIAVNALYEVVKCININHPDVIYSDEDKIDESGARSLPFFKPDWSVDLLYSQMYICHFLVIKKELFEYIGGFRREFDGSQDYDLMLRLSENTNNIVHIPNILYSWRLTSTSTSSNPNAKPYAHLAGLKALDMHLKKKYSEHAFAQESEYLFVYDARFDYLKSNPKVSIIIPTKDHVDLLDNCIMSILAKTAYQNYEILILNNNSIEPQTIEWFHKIVKEDNRIKIYDASFDFNWSKLNNFGISHASGDVYVFLNNDTIVIKPDWLERLSENALRDDIGVVGALLLYEDQTIQHAGVVVGMGGWADHVYKGQPLVHYGSPYVSPAVNRNVLAVTGACMAISRKTIKKIGRFNESFIVCGSDVEICIRAHKMGLINLYDSRVVLYHMESKSRDSFIPPIDFELSEKHYSPYRENGDPFYNKNLDINSFIPKVRG